jgi:hypothetical protein
VEIVHDSENQLFALKTAFEAPCARDAAYYYSVNQPFLWQPLLWKTTPQTEWFATIGECLAAAEGPHPRDETHNETLLRDLRNRNWQDMRTDFSDEEDALRDEWNDIYYAQRE